MKKRTRLLSMFLAILMIVGVMPMSVFAIDPADLEKEPDELESGSVDEYVSKNGGKLVFATEFENPSKITTTSDYNSVIGEKKALFSKVTSNLSTQPGSISISSSGDDGGLGKRR